MWFSSCIAWASSPPAAPALLLTITIPNTSITTIIIITCGLFSLFMISSIGPSTSVNVFLSNTRHTRSPSPEAVTVATRGVEGSSSAISPK